MDRYVYMNAAWDREYPIWKPQPPPLHQYFTQPRQPSPQQYFIQPQQPSLQQYQQPSPPAQQYFTRPQQYFPHPPQPPSLQQLPQYFSQPSQQLPQYFYQQQQLAQYFSQPLPQQWPQYFPPQQLSPQQWPQYFYQPQQLPRYQPPQPSLLNPQQPSPQQKFYQPQQLPLYQQPPEPPQQPQQKQTIRAGNLLYWMDEGYISNCFAQMGELVAVKISGDCAFLEFANRVAAERVLQTYNGTSMPGVDLKFNLSLAAGEKGPADDSNSSGDSLKLNYKYGDDIERFNLHLHMKVSFRRSYMHNSNVRVSMKCKEDSFPCDRRGRIELYLGILAAVVGKENALPSLTSIGDSPHRYWIGFICYVSKKAALKMRKNMACLGIYDVSVPLAPIMFSLEQEYGDEFVDKWDFYEYVQQLPEQPEVELEEVGEKDFYRSTFWEVKPEDYPLLDDSEPEPDVSGDKCPHDGSKSEGHTPDLSNQHDRALQPIEFTRRRFELQMQMKLSFREKYMFYDHYSVFMGPKNSFPDRTRMVESFFWMLAAVVGKGHALESLINTFGTGNSIMIYCESVGFVCRIPGKAALKMKKNKACLGIEDVCVLNLGGGNKRDEFVDKSEFANYVQQLPEHPDMVLDEVGEEEFYQSFFAEVKPEDYPPLDESELDESELEDYDSEVEYW